MSGSAQKMLASISGSILFAAQTVLAATGSIAITSHDAAEKICAENKLVISGTFLMEEDDSPMEYVVNSPYCEYSPSRYPAKYVPVTVLPMSNSTHAYLFYQLGDDSAKHIVNRIYSSYLGGWSQVGQPKNFSFSIDPGQMESGSHLLELTFQDWFGVYCYSTASRSYGYARGYWGEIMDSVTLNLMVPAGEEGCETAPQQTTANPDPGNRPCVNQAQVGSAVNVANGNLHDSHQISPSGKFPVTLSYNSRSDRESLFGYGWNGDFDLRLLINGNGSVVLVDGDGREELYEPEGDGSFLTPAGTHDLLTRTGAEYQLRRSSGELLTFDPDGRALLSEDRNGNQITYGWSDGKLLGLAGPDGTALSFTLDDAGRITTIGDDVGRTTILGYDSAGNLTSITDPAGQVRSFTYDAEHNLLSKTDPLGNITRYAYDGHDRLAGSLDPANQNRTVQYASESVTRVLDPAGNSTEYTYNQDRYVTRKVNALGNVIEHTWDEDFNRTAVTDSSGTVLFAYDQQGKVLSRTDQDGNTTSFTYDAAGNLLTDTGPAGEVISYSYDRHGNLTAVTDPAGNTARFIYDEQGRIIAKTNANGQATAFTYDAAGNLVQVIDPAGAVMAMSYDQAGNMDSATDPAGTTTRYGYDALGRLLRVTDAAGNATVYQYDPLGNRTAVIDANGNTTRMEYDHQGRVTKIIDGLGQATALTYAEAGCNSCGGAGNGDKPLSLTDSNGNTTTFSYDALGRLTAETDPLGNLTRYGHDAKGNVTSRTDAGGATISYSYDRQGRLLAKTFPDGSQTTFGYDRRGNLITAANQHLGYEMQYDAANRLLSVLDSNGRTLSYGYDPLGNRVKMITPEGKEVSYAYDPANRLSRIDSWAGVFELGHDLSGRRTSFSFPNGSTTGYGYDPLGSLTEILTRGGKNDRTLSALTYTHDKVGSRLHKTVFDRHQPATRYEYAYDPVYRLLESWSVKVAGKEKPQPNKSEVFAYDPLGNRLTGPENSDSYAYDQANQLLAGPNYAYQYDLKGNQIGKIGFDEEGKYISWTYEYDFEGRLVLVTKTAAEETTAVTFKYDPFGRRIEKRVERLAEGDQKTKVFTYVYDHEDIILEIRSGVDDREERGGHQGKQAHHRAKNSKETVRYLHGPGIDEPLAVETQGALYFYHADGLGSIISLTDAQGRIVQNYEYSSFGILKQHGNHVKQPYTYTGREWDKETGLYFYRARYYDPGVGRFISRDPIGFAGGDVNLYGYTSNNPINFVDPMGLKCGSRQNDWIIPDSWWGKFCFEKACEEHDDCYARCSSSKSQCDKEFKKNMLTACDGLKGTIKFHCKSMAISYYNAVKNLGKSSYNQAQKCCE